MTPPPAGSIIIHAGAAAPPREKARPAEYAGMMELADMRDLGSRAAMRWGSSPHARTTSEQTALHCVPRLCRGTFVPLRLFLLLKTATAALGCGFVFLGGAGGLLCPAVPRGFAAGHALRFGLSLGGAAAVPRCAPRLRRGTCAALGFIMRDKQRAACGAALWGFMGIYSASATLSTP